MKNKKNLMSKQRDDELFLTAAVFTLSLSHLLQQITLDSIH